MYRLAQSFSQLLSELNYDPLSDKVDTLLSFVSAKIKATSKQASTEVCVTVIPKEAKDQLNQLLNAAALLKTKDITLLYQQRKKQDGLWILAEPTKAPSITPAIQLKVKQPTTITNLPILLQKQANLKKAA